jgi:hypothetical protein
LWRWWLGGAGVAALVALGVPGVPVGVLAGVLVVWLGLRRAGLTR